MPETGTTAPTSQYTRNMQFVQTDETRDSVLRLEELVGETQKLVKQGNASVRELKKQIRAAKIHFRDREKQIGTHEKEIGKSLALIQRLPAPLAVLRLVAYTTWWRGRRSNQ